MPELPEVESARRRVHARCVGATITQVLTLESGGGPRAGEFDDIVLAVPQAALEKALLGKTLLDTARCGKLQWWCLGDGGGGGASSGRAAPTSYLSWHFGMTGGFGIQGEAGDKLKRYSVDTSQWPPRFTKLELVFSNGARLAFTDPRRLGRVRLPASPVAATAGLGPDAFLALPPLPAFGELLRRAVPIKALLMDQAVVAGLGNYLCDEILYAARIHPESPAAAVLAHPAALAALHAAIASTLATACGCGADYEQFPADWLFHVRWGKGKEGKSMPDGSAVTWITVGGRTSAFVASKQKKLSEKGGSSSGGGGGGGGGGSSSSSSSSSSSEAASQPAGKQSAAAAAPTAASAGPARSKKAAKRGAPPEELPAPPAAPAAAAAQPKPKRARKL